MLVKVHPEVDWAQVSTAYGPPVHVPVLLKTLYPPVPAQGAAASADLRSALCHQQKVYEASAAAVHLLCEAARETPFRVRTRPVAGCRGAPIPEA